MDKIRIWLNKHTKWIFTIPTLVFVVVCIGYPLCYALYMSVHEWRMSLVQEPTFIGLKNYADLLTDGRTFNAIGFTFKYFVVASIFEVGLGVILALMLNGIRRGKGFIRTIFIFPMVATPIAMGYVWKAIFDSSSGLINVILRFLGVQSVNWFAAGTVFKTLMIAEVWSGTPLIILIVLAGLSSLGSDYFEAAKIDGANGIQLIFKITLPLLSPTIMMAFLLRGIEVLKAYDLIYAMTQGGPNHSTENLNLYVYSTAFDYMQMGKASALMILFFVIVMAFALVAMIVRHKMEKRYS